MLAIRKLAQLSADKYEIEERWLSGKPRSLRLREDVRIGKLPCKANEPVILAHDVSLLSPRRPALGHILAATLAEDARLHLSPWRSVTCLAGTRVSFDLFFLSSFTPAEDVVVSGLHLARGHEVRLWYGCEGALAEAQSFAGVMLPAGASIEEDPDDSGLLNARLEQASSVAGHELPAGRVISVRRRRSLLSLLQRREEASAVVRLGAACELAGESFAAGERLRLRADGTLERLS